MTDTEISELYRKLLLLVREARLRRKFPIIEYEDRQDN